MMMTRPRSNPGFGMEGARYPGTFLLALREAVAAVGWKGGKCQGPVVVCHDSAMRPRNINATALYDSVRGDNRADWPVLIEAFFRSQIVAEQGEPLEHGLTEGPRLLAQIGTESTRPPGGGIRWTDPIPETDLGIHLVVDDESGARWASTSAVAESDRPAEAWRAAAIHNLAARTPDDWLRFDPQNGFYRGDGDMYSAARALLLDQLLPQAGPLGAFVAIPGRDALAVLPASFQALSTLHLLKSFAQNHYRQTPVPISGSIYWVRRGVWLLFPVHVRGGLVNIEPPPEFIELLSHESEPGTTEAGSAGPGEPADPGTGMTAEGSVSDRPPTPAGELNLDSPSADEDTRNSMPPDSPPG